MLCTVVACCLRLPLFSQFGRVGRLCWVLLSVPGRPTNLDNSRAKAHCACSRSGLGVIFTDVAGGGL